MRAFLFERFVEAGVMVVFVLGLGLLAVLWPVGRLAYGASRAIEWAGAQWDARR